MKPTGRWRVCVLWGGETGERSVSLRSGAAVADALVRLGHEVRVLDPATGRGDPVSPGRSASELIPHYEPLVPDLREFLPSLSGLKVGSIDLVANILHGGAGEGGRVQAVLEMAGIEFTGSGASASTLAMDKVLSKAIFRDQGIPVAEELLWHPSTDPATSRSAEAAPADAPTAASLEPLGGYPVVVKPIAGGSTVGVTIVHDPSGWAEAASAAAGQIDPVRGLLVERFVPGRELTVGILEDQALPVVEIVPKSGFYDFKRKYTKGETVYEVPARVPEEIARRLQEWAVLAYRALGCRDMARVDFRLDPGNRAVCLEINTIPGMTETSLLPMAAGAAGIGFDELVGTLCRRAVARGRHAAAVEGEEQDVA